VSTLEAFAGELKRLRIGQLVYARL